MLRASAAATLIRPAVMFGPDDAFVAPLLSRLRRLPAFPLFGSGRTRLQPVYVEDIGEAVARIIRLRATEQIYELAGPQLYDYRSLDTKEQAFNDGSVVAVMRITDLMA